MRKSVALAATVVVASSVVACGGASTESFCEKYDEMQAANISPNDGTLDTAASEYGRFEDMLAELADASPAEIQADVENFVAAIGEIQDAAEDSSDYAEFNAKQNEINEQYDYGASREAIDAYALDHCGTE